MEKTINVHEFLKLAGISKQTLYKWYRVGNLKKRKLNNRALYFTPNDLARVPALKAKMIKRMSTHNHKNRKKK